MGLPWKPRLFVEHLLCAFATERKTQDKRAALESSVLCSLQVADRIFVVSVQVCQFVLTSHEPGYQENVPEEKKNQSAFLVIRLVSWAWISSFELRS